MKAPHKVEQVIAITILSMLVGGVFPAFAQSGESPINIFGYFQTSLQHWTKFDVESTHPQFGLPDGRPAQNSFNLQQLNLFFSKNLARRWRAFINFEFLNSFSSGRGWGAAKLEEAWVRYKAGDKFNLKVGLLIPTFNNLNEIKNRTPLLPYIIRPIFYETSFSEFFDNFEELVPDRAFAQAAGVLPAGRANFDYAVYLGNSPNINNQSEVGQTGVDTTDTFLVGGRIGIRGKDLKIGLSATRENVNLLAADFNIDGQSGFLVDFKETPRVRLGTDLSFHLGKLYFEGEFIAIRYDDQEPEVSIDKDLFYATLGYRFDEKWFAYANYSSIRGDFPFVATIDQTSFTDIGRTKIITPTVGIAYNLDDRITLKGQFLSGTIQNEFPLLQSILLVQKQKFKIISAAVSVFF